MSMGAATQVMVQPTVAQETLPVAGTMGVSESVVVDTAVITQTPLKPFTRFGFWCLVVTLLHSGGECRCPCMCTFLHRGGECIGAIGGYYPGISWASL